MEYSTKLAREKMIGGKLCKYVNTDQAPLKPGYLMDTYQDENGSLHYEYRLKNHISHASYDRNSDGGQFQSFSMTVNKILTGVGEGASSEDLQVLFKQLEYPLEKAKKFLAKKYTEDLEEVFITEVATKVSETINEITLNEPSPAMIETIGKLIEYDEIKNMEVVHKALTNELEKMIDLCKFDEDFNEIN